MSDLHQPNTTTPATPPRLPLSGRIVVVEAPPTNTPANIELLNLVDTFPNLNFWRYPTLADLKTLAEELTARLNDSNPAHPIPQYLMSGRIVDMHEMLSTQTRVSPQVVGLVREFTKRSANSYDNFSSIKDPLDELVGEVVPEWYAVAVVFDELNAEQDDGFWDRVGFSCRSVLVFLYLVEASIQDGKAWWRNKPRGTEGGDLGAEMEVEYPDYHLYD